MTRLTVKFAGHPTKRFSRWLAMSGLASCCWSPTQSRCYIVSAARRKRVRLDERTTVSTAREN